VPEAGTLERKPKIEYFALLFDDEVSISSPDAIFRSMDRGVRLEYLRRNGEWVDDPALASYFRGEPGTEPITEEQVRRIVKKWDIDETVLAT